MADDTFLAILEEALQVRATQLARRVQAAELEQDDFWRAWRSNDLDWLVDAGHVTPWLAERVREEARRG